MPVMKSLDAQKFTDYYKQKRVMILKGKVLFTEGKRDGWN